MCFVSDVWCDTEGHRNSIYVYTLASLMRSYLCMAIDDPRDAVGPPVLWGAFTARPCHVVSCQLGPRMHHCETRLGSFLGVAFLSLTTSSLYIDKENRKSGALRFALSTVVTAATQRLPVWRRHLCAVRPHTHTWVYCVQFKGFCWCFFEGGFIGYHFLCFSFPSMFFWGSLLLSTIFPCQVIFRRFFSSKGIKLFSTLISYLAPCYEKSTVSCLIKII